jgi:hypothetical protein
MIYSINATRRKLGAEFRGGQVSLSATKWGQVKNPIKNFRNAACFPARNRRR